MSKVLNTIGGVAARTPFLKYGWWVSFAHDPRVNFAQVQEREGKWTAC